MHLMGEAALVEHHHDGQKDVLIDEPYFSYDNPKTFEWVFKCTYLHQKSPSTTWKIQNWKYIQELLHSFCGLRYKPEVVLKPGNELMTRCVYNTVSRQENTYYGDDTFNEMCYGIFTYYPAEKGR